jgi:phosphoglycerate kinase
MQFVPGIKALIVEFGDKVVVPSDLALCDEDRRIEVTIDQLPTDYLICDIGHKTVDNYRKIILAAKALVVSGPMGVYEKKEYNYGTKGVLQAIADSKAFSLAGGGNTIAAIAEYGLTNKIGYISTAGGALIEFLMGKKLPGVAALETAVTVKKI